MKILAILAFTALGFWLLVEQWGMLALACAGVVGWLIRSDKRHDSVDTFFAWCFGLILIGAALNLLGLVSN